MDKRYRTKNGAMIWTTVTTRLQRDEKGQPLFFLTHILDITQRKQTEADLNERVKELHCFQTVSDLALQDDLPLDQLLSRIPDLLPPGWLHPQKTCVRLSWGGQTYLSAGFQETRWRQTALITPRGGMQGRLEVFFLGDCPAGQKTPFLPEENALLRSIATRVETLIERQTMDGTLQTDRRRLLALLDGIEDVIYVSDPQTCELLHVNKAARRLWGEDIVGQKCHTILQGRDAPCPFCTNDRIFGDHLGETYVWEFCNEATGRWFRCADKAIRWTDGRWVRFELAADISKRKELEKKLQELNQDLVRSNKELEQFAYVASHDLQEPLRMVASYTQLLARRYQGQLDTKADKYIRYAVDGAKRMQELINDLLAFSRVGTRGKPPQEVDCNEVLAEVLETLGGAIKKSGATVTAAPLPTVFADRIQLGQVLQNLVGNAIKFRAEAPPEIEISAREEDDSWIFGVRDNGVGLDPQFAERIFVIFQRLHTREEYPGSGIGLSIAKKIVERHGGKIWVEAAPGQGSHFRFSLPKDPPKVFAASKEEAHP